MDWSLALRTYRARNGLKQEALADLLHISQAYVSRLESGKLEPKDGLEHKIRSLISNPGQRDVLDFVLNSVRVSPHISIVLAVRDDRLSYIALSDGFRQHPQFKEVGEGDTLTPEFIEQGEDLLRELIATGAFLGETACVEILWRAVRNESSFFWNTVLTPIRAEEGEWYLHAAMTALSEDHYHDTHRRRGSALCIHPVALGENASFTAA